MALTQKKADFNSDLVWDITEFRERKRAALFIKSFENSFCVFSGSVNQLYTNYTINFPESNPSKIIILPNQYRYHDTFNSVPEPSVIETRIQLVRQGDNAEPMLRIPFKAGKKRYHTVPLSTGLNIVRRFFGRDDPFLPVLVKGDLRELDISTPFLQLHRIRLPELLKMSLFERSGIMNAINKKLRFIK